MLKRLTMLAMAIAAVVAFAVPAVASAEEGVFVHNGGVLGHEDFTGVIGFSTEVSTFECEAHATVDLAAEPAKLVELNVTTDKCQGTGLLGTANLVADELTGEPTLTPTPAATPPAVDIKGVVLHNVFDNIGAVTLTFPVITAVVDNAAAISTLTLSGEGIADTALGELPSEAYGELEAANPETYGIE